MKTRTSAVSLAVSASLLVFTPSWAQGGPAQNAFDAAVDAAKMAMMTDPAVALDKARTAHRLAQQPGAPNPDIRLATAEWLESEALIRTERPQAALPIVQEALAVIEKRQPDSKLHGDLLMARGGAHASLGQVQPALEDFQKAHDVFRDADQPRGQAKALQEIGSIYQSAGDYPRVLHYYNQSAEAYDEDPALLVSAFNNKANAYKEMGQFDPSIAEFRRGVDLARKAGSPLLEVSILTNLASTEIAAGRLSAADADLARARALAHSGPAAQERPFIDGVAGQAALKRGHYAQAAQLVEGVFKGVDLNATNPAFRDFHDTAYQAYTHLGRQDLALAHLRAFKRIDDQTRAVAASTNAALMAARFDFANQDLKIAKLKAGQLERDVQLARTRGVISLILLGGLTIVLALLTVGFLSIRRSRNAVRAANVNLNAANGSLEKALKAKTEFLATTSHEIRTPLNGILGMTQVLLADRAVEASVRDKISIVHGAGEAMKALVDDLLDVAKMETGKLTVRREPVDLTALLRDTAKLWGQQAQSKGLDLALDIDAAPPRIVEDGGRLRQVLFNLMSNAIKFTDKGQVCLSVDVTETSDGERLRLTVRDTGVGIPSDQIEQAFESFKQLDGGLSRRHAGTGLGLTICRNLVQALGGRIEVESVVGQGSAFIVDLPLERAQGPAYSGSANEGGLAALNVLIIDANPLAQAVVRALFQGKVRGLEIVASAVAARESLSTRPADLILAESAALGEDAVSAIAALAAGPSRPLLAVLRANLTDEDRTSLTAAGADAVIAKPIAGPALTAMLEDLATRSRHAQDDKGLSALSA